MVIEMSPDDDPVHVFDQLVHAQRELIAAHVAAGAGDEQLSAIVAGLREEVAAMDLQDLPAQRAMTSQLDSERRLLVRATGSP